MSRSTSALPVCALFALMVMGCNRPLDSEFAEQPAADIERTSDLSSVPRPVRKVPKQRDSSELMITYSPGAFKRGDVPPQFVLPALDGRSKTDLSQLVGKKPVLLLFGSYT